MSKSSSTNRAFTLIELLTVIAIIGVLVGLLFPAIKSAMTKAETSKAQTAISGLSTAFKSYYTEYGKWPITDTATVPPNENTYLVDANMVALLQGVNVGSLSSVLATPYGPGAGFFSQANPRGIHFLDIKTADLNQSGAFVDPWKAVYRVRFDAGYYNSIADPFDSTKPAIIAGFLIWSPGPDGQDNPTCGDPPGPYSMTPCVNKDNVKSW